jgi:hypothetical protein
VNGPAPVAVPAVSAPSGSDSPGWFRYRSMGPVYGATDRQGRARRSRDGRARRPAGTG